MATSLRLVASLILAPELAARPVNVLAETTSLREGAADLVRVLGEVTKEAPCSAVPRGGIVWAGMIGLQRRPFLIDGDAHPGADTAGEHLRACVSLLETLRVVQGQHFSGRAYKLPRGIRR